MPWKGTHFVLEGHEETGMVGAVPPLQLFSRWQQEASEPAK